MGQQVVYCSVCGVKLLPRDFEKGGALQAGDTNFCNKCREGAGVPLPEPAPESEKEPNLPRRTTRRVINGNAHPSPPSYKTARHSRTPPRGTPPRTMIVAGAVGGFLFLIVLLLILGSTTSVDPPPQQPDKPPPPKPVAKKTTPVVQKQNPSNDLDSARKWAIRLENTLKEIRKTWEATGFTNRKEIEKRLEEATALAGEHLPEGLPDVRQAKNDFRNALEEAADKAGEPLLREAESLPLEKAVARLATFPDHFSGTRMEDRIKSRIVETRRKLEKAEPPPPPKPVAEEPVKPDPVKPPQPVETVEKEPVPVVRVPPPVPGVLCRQDFEKPESEWGWDRNRVSHETDHSHEGKGSCRLGKGKEAKRTSWIKKTFQELKPDTTYEMSAWYRSNKKAEFSLVAKFSEEEQVRTRAVAGQEWARLRSTFQTGTSTRADIYLWAEFTEFPEGTVVYVDNFLLKRTDDQGPPPPEPEPANSEPAPVPEGTVIYQAFFDEGQHLLTGGEDSMGWRGHNNSVSDEKARSGKYALKLEGGDDRKGKQEQGFRDLAAGKTHELSLWFCSDQEGDFKLMASVGEKAKNKDIEVSLTRKWTRLSLTFTPIRDSKTTLKFEVKFESGRGGCAVFVDDIILRRID